MEPQATSNKQEALQKMLLQLRNTFLDDMPEKLDRLEHLLLEMEKHGSDSETFNEAYRIIHSLKGSGGTFGLHIITTICHQTEDLLNATDGGTKFTPRLIGFSLKYLDLLQLALKHIHTGADSFPLIEQQLLELRRELAPKRFSVLLADNSKLETNICLQTLAALPVHTVVVNDGLDALTRALAEPFDLIITTNEIPRLSGGALVGALKLSDVRSPRLKTILLTSSRAVADTRKRGTDADFTILKNGKLVQNLTEAVKRALNIAERT